MCSSEWGSQKWSLLLINMYRNLTEIVTVTIDWIPCLFRSWSIWGNMFSESSSLVQLVSVVLKDSHTQTFHFLKVQEAQSERWLKNLLVIHVVWRVPWCVFKHIQLDLVQEEEASKKQDGGCIYQGSPHVTTGWFLEMPSLGQITENSLYSARTEEFFSATPLMF